MLNIATLSRFSGIDRRTIQLWADEEVILPTKIPGENRRLYSERELEVVRLLKPFLDIGASVKMLQNLSINFRDNLLGGNPDPRTQKFFAPLVKKAREGKNVLLVVQIDPDSLKVKMKAAETPRENWKICTDYDKSAPSLPVVTIGLTSTLCRALNQYAR